MKKLMMIFFALVAMTTVEAQTVYIAPSSGAIAYHKSKSCSYLKNSANVKAVSTSEAKDMGRHACVRCYPEQKEQTMKAIAKEKKTTATKKATTQARDEKGRFVKKTDATTKKADATVKKATTQARDEKGRFVKKTETTKTTPDATVKKTTTQARDAKGRFVKKTE